MKSEELEPVRLVIRAARQQAPELGVLLEQHFPGLHAGGLDATTLPVKYMTGTRGLMTPVTWDAVAVWHGDFLFVAKASDEPMVSIDDGPKKPMTPVAGTPYWYRLEQLSLGTTYSYRWSIGDRDFGTGDVAGYTAVSYELPGIKRGILSEKHTIASSIYPTATTDYWTYANPGIDTKRGAPVMLWFDAPSYLGTSDLFNYRLKIVSDNLVHKGLIPPMVHVLVSPSDGGEPLAPQFPGQSQSGAMRSLQFDTVSDRYARHVLEEILPNVEKTYPLRQDAYSRGAAGQSSGGICSFTLCWFRSDAFSRAHSAIGSFTGLQWDPDRHIDGGNILPNLVRRGPRRNIRVWMSEGMNDLDVDSTDRPDLFVAGSWPLGNIQLANALKLTGHDFHFRYGLAGHNSAQPAVDLPESLAWLWRDYDPEKTSQTFEQDAAERAQPMYRVQIANRDAW